MIKTLRKHGNSQALPVDKATMQAMGIDVDTPLQITISGNNMIVSPADVGVGQEAIDRSLRKMRQRYGPALRRLAKG
jgi:antitoxin component of MazEF toxin-antitoxin module